MAYQVLGVKRIEGQKKDGSGAFDMNQLFVRDRPFVVCRPREKPTLTISAMPPRVVIPTVGIEQHK